jgi:hypothetical protein
MNFDHTGKFAKDLKKLSKKYFSLDEDLAEFKKILSVFPIGKDRHFTILRVSKGAKIAKARLFCKTLKGSSLRIIYAQHDQLEKIVFIELYYKGDQQREDNQRIEDYLHNHLIT